MQIISPRSVDDALKKISENDDALIMANGTDVMPRIRDGEITANKVLDLSAIGKELSYIIMEGDLVKIGSMTTVDEIGKSGLFGTNLRAFYEVSRNFGGPQIRNRATIGGNVCAASSSEDFIPLLLALDASVKLASVDGTRLVGLGNFINGKRKIDRKGSEIVTELQFKAPHGSYVSGFEKFGKRRSLIINIVNMAMLLKVANGKVQDARIALNRLSGKVPARAKLTETFLSGMELNGKTISGAQEVLRTEMKLTSDIRASARYRERLAEIILGRLIGRLSEEMKI
ncbi:MAG: FAD binding domain-containing protein [Nitrososphaerota archaeon]|nr:FAD binding domain-containing protein [Nitrososphaerota archaeon]MDG6931348.1 FAD binding domain-containing protein [Nitrososphaerota archaeon]